MEQKDDIKKELAEISPLLGRMKKENPFEVPANYFEQLPGQIMEQARLTPVERPSSTPSWKEQLRTAFSFMFRPRVALGVLGLVALTWTGIFIFKDSQPNTEFAEDPFLIEADAYIAANLDEFDEDLLGEVAFGEVEEELSFPADMEMDKELMNEILDDLEAGDLEDLL